MTSSSADEARRERRVRLDRRKRRCNACARGFAVLLVLLTLFGSFFPFEWNPPLWLGNGARREGSAIRFTGPGMVEVALGDRFAGSLTRREVFEIELEFTAESPASNASLLVLVAEPLTHERLAVTARGTVLDVGFAESHRFTRDLRVDEALAVGTTTWCRVVLNPILDRWPWPEPIELRRSDGVSHDPPDDNWPLHWGATDACELRVLLGNDVHGDAPFLGTIRRAVLRFADQSVDLLDEDLCRLPSSFWRLPRSLQDPFWAWGGMTPDLYVMGALWFAVLVAVFGRTFARRRVRGHRSRALVAGAALAAFTELGQLVFDGREVAWADVITAWLGCVLGLGLLALRATSRADRGELDIAPPPHPERAPR